MPQLRRLCRIVALTALALAVAALAAGCSARAPRISRLTILVSGNTLGYLKNCGCSTGQAGGEVRKARVLKEERADAVKPKPADKGRPADVVMIDIGNFVDPSTEVQRIYSEGVVRAMSTQAFNAVGMGMSELSYGQEALSSLLRDAKLPLVATNLRFVPPKSGSDHSAELNALFQPFLIVRLGSGYKVGIVHIIDVSVARELAVPMGFELRDAAKAVNGVLAQHAREAQMWILTAADVRRGGTDPGSLADIKGLTEVIGYKEGNPRQSQTSTKAVAPYFVQPPFDRAMDVVRVEISMDSRGKVAAALPQEVAIPETVNADPEVEKIIMDLQPILEQLETRKAQESLQNQPGVHPRYVSSDTCGVCHKDIVGQLASSAHTQAYDSLVAQGQQKSAACLPCHVVGQNQPGGWDTLLNPSAMRGVQCESCHGPGEYHEMKMARKPVPADFAAGGRNRFGLLPMTREGCVVCHDKMNSPRFDYDTYWPKIAHKMKQRPHTIARAGS